MKTYKFIACAAVALLLTACGNPKLGYFQNVQSSQVSVLPPAQLIKAQPGDKLSILVSSKNPQLAYLYNLPIVGHYETASSLASLGNSRVASYRVDEAGDIQFPVVGALHIAGMTRSEIAVMIKQKLISGNYLNDATVTVDFLDMYFSVMGEVKLPGRFIIDHDKVTLLDALSRAGDLTIHGRRDNVLVSREENGRQYNYRVNLTNTDSVYHSPAFYLKQDDIVYVEPNEKRAREATGVGNTFSSSSFWVSVASLLTSVSVLIFK